MFYYLSPRVSDMLIFIDESGDTGFKVQIGSSPNFVIAGIIFRDNLDAERTALAIKELKRELNFSDDYEFKFTKCCNDIRKKFLQRVKKFNFTYRAVVMRKELIYGNQLRTDKEYFHNYTMRMLLEHTNGSIVNAKVKVDKCGDRDFRRHADRYLKEKLNVKDKIIRGYSFEHSHGNVLIQLADMVAGAINRSYTTKKDAQEYRNIIKTREENVWVFGEGYNDPFDE